MTTPILTVHELKKYFPIKGGFLNRAIANVHAVDGVSLHLNKGETLGLVGESGCGKSTIGRAVLRLFAPSAGEIFLGDTNITRLSQGAMRKFRRRIQPVFQDPYESLNPRQRVLSIVSEPIRNFENLGARELRDRVADLFDRVGLTSESIDKYPHEFSGGQRQRICIARALGPNPEIIILDEAVSALDVSVQAQILNLLSDLQRDLGMAFMFISHDLAVVEHISHRVAVMYLGKIVETAPKKALFAKPIHPYTQALMAAIPVPDPEYKREKSPLEGDVPSPINPPSGCRFHTRCPIACDICRHEVPELRQMEDQHFVACHLN